MVSRFKRAIFFDRDGVINALVNDSTVSGRSPRQVAEFSLLPGIKEALNLAESLAYIPLVVTNQPEIARGRMTEQDLIDIHQELLTAFPAIRDIYACHHSGNICSCRKPKPGLLLRAAAEHGVDIGRSWMIGDRWVDIAAADACGARSVLISMPYSWRRSSAGMPPVGLQPTLVARDVLDAVCQIAVSR